MKGCLGSSPHQRPRSNITTVRRRIKELHKDGRVGRLVAKNRKSVSPSAGMKLRLSGTREQPIRLFDRAVAVLLHPRALAQFYMCTASKAIGHGSDWAKPTHSPFCGSAAHHEVSGLILLLNQEQLAIRLLVRWCLYSRFWYTRTTIAPPNPDASPTGSLLTYFGSFS